MSLPYFYIPDYAEAQTNLHLPEETSRHVVQVLRMQPGDKMHLTDGRGSLLVAEITEAHKKHSAVKVLASRLSPAPSRHICMGVSLLKNTQRFEWFVEKATELGVNEIIPLLCERTEKERFRYDRMQAICISAMLQSQQTRLPLLHEPVSFNRALEQIQTEQRLIAHCLDDADKKPLASLQISVSSALLIGPEGDFGPPEIGLAGEKGWSPVSLGQTRLRTETAAVAGAVWLTQGI